MMGRKEYFGVLTLLAGFLSMVAAGKLVSRDNLNVPHELEELSDSREKPIQKRNYGTYFVPQPHPGYIYPQEMPQPQYPQAYPQVYPQVMPQPQYPQVMLQPQQEYVQIYPPPQHQQYIHFFPSGQHQQQEHIHINGPPEYLHILPRDPNCNRRPKGRPPQPGEWTTHRPPTVAVDHEADTRSEEVSHELEFLTV